MRDECDSKLRIAYAKLEMMRLQQHIAWIRLSSSRKEYNPNQPRIPANQTGGGRWTSDGSAKDQTSISYPQFRELLRQTSMTQDECDEMHRRELIVCKFTGIPACYAQAMVRLAACERGHPIPPLNF